MSLPNTATVDAPRRKRSRRGPRWANRLALLLTLALVTAPLLYAATCEEIAAWQAAIGQEAAWNGDYRAAIARLDQALAWDAENADYFALRSEARTALGELEAALADAEQALKLEPVRPAIVGIYTDALMRVGRADEAAAFYQRRLKAVGEQDAQQVARLRNNIAYYLAVANKDLDLAYEQVTLALDPDAIDLGILDTRAMVLYRQGKHDEALRDLNVVIQKMESRRRKDERAVGNMAIDERHYERLKREWKRVLAQSYYHRELVLTALAKEEASFEKKMKLALAASNDRLQVIEFGFTPDMTLF